MARQTPSNHEDDTGIQNKVLLPGASTENQSLGNELSRLHRQQKNRHETNLPRNAEQYRSHYGARRLPRR